MQDSQPNHDKGSQSRSKFYFPVDSGILLYRRNGTIEYFPYGWAGTVTPKPEKPLKHQNKTNRPKPTAPLPGTKRHKRRKSRSSGNSRKN